MLFLPTFARAQDGGAKIDMPRLKQRLLDIINRERRNVGLRPVELDDLASQVAQQHCREMLNGGYTSHWNEAGLKPYMRYSLAGGVDAVKENVAGKWSNSGIDPARVPELIEQLHIAMFNERPPDDYHRRNILQPEHTHVGLGIAFNDGSVQLAEEFVSRYVELQPISHRAKTGDLLTLKGQLLFEKTDIYNIEIFYEPSPRPLSVDALNRTGDYSFPKDHLVMRPMLAAGYSYSDGSAGSINYQPASGDFSCPIDFHGAQSGIYTIVVWVNQGETRFPVTNISIEVH
jgi:uncharacterized protein YkwD